MSGPDGSPHETTFHINFARPKWKGGGGGVRETLKPTGEENRKQEEKSAETEREISETGQIFFEKSGKKYFGYKITWL